MFSARINTGSMNQKLTEALDEVLYIVINNENKLQEKTNITSTEPHSSSPVCDGHHHGDRPSERQKRRQPIHYNIGYPVCE